MSAPSPAPPAPAAATRVSGLIVSAMINIAIAAAAGTLYSVFQRHHAVARIYYARHVLREIRERRRSPDSEPLLPPRRPPQLSELIPSARWVRSAWRLTEDEVLESSGLDAVVFLRIFIFCFRFFGVCAILGLCILLPINYFEGHVDIMKIPTDPLDNFSISNVVDSSNRLWAHFVILYFMSFLAYGLLYMEYKNITKKRLRYLQGRQPQLDQFTVLVRAIPKCKDKSYEEQVDFFFRNYHRQTYLLHHMVYDNRKVQKMLHTVDDLVNEIETLKSVPVALRSPYRTGLLAWFSQYEDPLDFKVKQLEGLLKRIKESQAEIVNVEKELPISFVSFKTRWGATMAAQAQQTSNPLEWVTEWAPQPRDVNWRNLVIPFQRLWIMRLVVKFVFFWIIVLFFIPAGLVYTLATLHNLMAWFPFIKQILSIPFVSSFISGYLPSLLLAILYYCIPPLMLSLTKWEGYPSCSSEERKASGKVFLFLVGNSFFLVTYGSLLGLIGKVIESPKQIPALLGFTVPGQANFFMNFIMTQGWAGLALEILQPDLLSLGFFMKYFLQKQQYGPYVQSMQYYRILPNLLLLIFIGFMYSMIAPLLIPFLMVFFIGGYIVYCNQIINVYEPAYETGGQYWPHVHSRIISAIFLMQVICIGIFGLKNKPAASTFSFPLLIITLMFNQYCTLRFTPSFKNLPIEIVVPRGEEEEEKGIQEDIFVMLQKAYLCPSLQGSDAIVHEESCCEPLIHQA